MTLRTTFPYPVAVLAIAGLFALVGCSRESDKTDESRPSTSEVSSDSKLLALKFHHDK